MRITVSVMLILFALGVKGADLLKIRAAFYRAAQDENEANSFLRTMVAMDEESPLITGYKGMAYLLLSKYAFNPLTKLENFRVGRAMLEKAIAQDGGDVELRFLRYTVQKALPSILNYSDKTAEDEQVVMNAVKTLTDADLKKKITDYFDRQQNNVDR